jgi:apolipoprotein N-acyltransferase
MSTDAAIAGSETAEGPAREDQPRVPGPAVEAGHSSQPGSWQLWTLACAGSVLLWLAFPPLGWWPLAWLAPAFWIRLVRQPRLPGRRPYLVLYTAGLLHWSLMTHWIRLPHWSAGFGWCAISLYLGVYLPLLVGAARILVHRWRMPTVIAAPVTWAGLELARGYLFTGFSLALLAHSQVEREQLIQLADLAGGYGVSFLIVLVAAAIERILPLHRGGPLCWWPVGVAAAALAVALGYGHWRLGQQGDTNRPRASVALVQGSVDTVFDGDPDRAMRTFRQYWELSRQAVAGRRQVDLVVWPESMFTGDTPRVTFEDGLPSPAEWPADAPPFQEHVANYAGWSEAKCRRVSAELDTAMLVGTESLHLARQGDQRFNSAIFIPRDGDPVVYHKMHPVMFGEYVPLGNVFPWLYQLTPMHGGLTAGTTPVSFVVAGLRFAPCICFENTVPHLLRRQVRQLQAQGGGPDVLVTITNDGWFWGSSLLDLHLACGVFRAVELRRPMLIAANTGFSAWIDGQGRVRRQGPRRATAVVMAAVQADGRNSPYLTIGDVPAALCCLVVGAALGSAALRRRWPQAGGRSRPARKPGR